MNIYIYIYILHSPLKDYTKTHKWTLININYQETTFSHRQPEWTRKLLIGKSQIIYKCKYRYIYKIIKKNAHIFSLMMCYNLRISGFFGAMFWISWTYDVYYGYNYIIYYSESIRGVITPIITMSCWIIITKWNTQGTEIIIISSLSCRNVWYFEEGGVVLWRGWCGTLKRVV